jgi:2-oxoglutarate ferredoxin oxidoreductase subunit beta
VYVIENNGVYGLTKGQFTATADVGSTLKNGTPNEYATIDVCGLAIELGATFVARSFSGDGKQLVPLLQAALSHRGTAIVDIVSPCVTFNDHEGSTKSYAYVKDHDVIVNAPDFIAPREEITVEYEPGTAQEIRLEDGSRVILRKVDRDYDATSRIGALSLIHETRSRGEFITGLLYVDTGIPDLIEREKLTRTPLKDLGENELRIPRAQWDAIFGD